MKYLIALLPLMLVACTADGNSAGDERVGDNSLVGPGGMAIAPYPYTPESIRARCVDGLSIDYRVTTAGAAPVIQTMSFREGDEEGVTVDISRSTADGKPLGTVRSTRSTWVELRDHAAFPAAATVRLREKATTAMGEWDCWVYVVVGSDGGTTRFWFADQLPGPPLVLDQEQDGDRIMRMEIVAIRLPEESSS